MKDLVNVKLTDYFIPTAIITVIFLLFLFARAIIMYTPPPIVHDDDKVSPPTQPATPVNDSNQPDPLKFKAIPKGVSVPYGKKILITQSSAIHSEHKNKEILEIKQESLNLEKSNNAESPNDSTLIGRKSDTGELVNKLTISISNQSAISLIKGGKLFLIYLSGNQANYIYSPTSPLKIKSFSKADHSLISDRIINIDLTSADFSNFKKLPFEVFGDYTPDSVRLYFSIEFDEAIHKAHKQHGLEKRLHLKVLSDGSISTEDNEYAM